MGIKFQSGKRDFKRSLWWWKIRCLKWLVIPRITTGENTVFVIWIKSSCKLQHLSFLHTKSPHISGVLSRRHHDWTALRPRSLLLSSSSSLLGLVFLSMLLTVLSDNEFKDMEYLIKYWNTSFNSLSTTPSSRSSSRYPLHSCLKYGVFWHQVICLIFIWK